MKRWPTKPLGELLRIQNGFAFKSELFNEGGKGLPIIRIRDLARGYSKIFYDGEHEPAFEVENGDFLIGMDGEFRCYQWQGGRALLNQRVCRLQDFSSNLNAGYVFYGINDHLRQIEDNTSFVTVKHLSSKQIASIEMPVPPLAEQERIVKLLDEADELLKLRAQADRRSADLIPALFHEMFGDPVANPMGWPLHKLPEACAGKEGIKAGPFGSSLKKDCYTAEGPRVYGQEQVIAGDFTIGDYHISEEKFNEMAAYTVAADDVLISLVGTIGKVAIVPGAIERGIINPRLLRVRPRREMMHPVYLSHVLTAPSIVTFFGGVATGITMGVLNAGMLKRLSIPVPPSLYNNNLPTASAKSARCKPRRPPAASAPSTCSSPCCTARSIKNCEEGSMTGWAWYWSSLQVVWLRYLSPNGVFVVNYGKLNKRFCFSPQNNRDRR